MISSVYVLGSLKNPAIPKVAAALRGVGLDVFDDWYAAGYEADDKWAEYERKRGRSYGAALGGYAAEHVFNYDKSHIDRCDASVLVAPAGRSAHLELGYAIGSGKCGFVYFPTEPERWDVMYRFADAVVFDIDTLLDAIRAHP